MEKTLRKIGRILFQPDTEEVYFTMKKHDNLVRIKENKYELYYHVLYLL